MQYYIGVDGGGTKTAICAAAQDASTLFSAITGSASWREYGIEPVVRNIKEVIGSFPLEGEGQIAGIAMGLPCYGESEEGDRDLEKAVREAFPNTPLYLTNDVEVGWAGSLGLASGVNVVAGTGAIAFGKDEKGKTARSGGWSEFFGDEGSCYWMGRKVMELFSKQSDGRMPQDVLYTTVRSELGLRSDLGFIDLMHDNYIINRDKVASLQLLANKAALAGSPSAKSLYCDAADELILLVKAICDRLHFTKRPFLVSYSGGLFKAGDLVLDRFSKGVAETGGSLYAPQFEPMHGALLLAFEQFCPSGLPDLRKCLEVL
ncbi:MAG: ATPase [Oscillospiraceae bacterium]|nr:ATPase [Oscillospiraceae bacterium]